MYFKTLANARKAFAWVTDPLMMAGDGLPRDLTNSVGFLKKDVDTLSDCCYFDLVVFKDAKTAEKYVPNKITGWDRISEDFFNAMDVEISQITDLEELNKYKDKFPKLITADNKFDRNYFNTYYLDYFMNQHIPGTEYESGFLSKLGKKIEEKTGASYLFEGGGITVEDNGGLKSIERPLHRINDGVDSKFDIDALSETNDMRVFRFEVTQDINKPVSVVEIGADSKK